MADIMSSFPDSILCYILSFLPTKDVVATSVLSKRWKLLWLSVTSMDFDHHDRMDFDKDACSRFLVPVYSFLLWRDMDQPLHRLRLRCCSFYNHYRVQTWIKAAMRRSGKLKHLDLNLDLFLAVPSVVFSCKTLVVLKLSHLMLSNISFVHLPLLKILHLNSVILTKCDDLLQHFLSGSPNLEDFLHSSIVVPSLVFSCKTLVVLKLANLLLKNIFFVDLPLLKILHLNSVSFSRDLDLLQQFLSVSPNLENLEVKNFNANAAEKFNRFSRLVRANIDAHLVPLENVKNVQVLVTDRICPKDLVFDLQNLVQLELTHVRLSKQWFEVLEVLQHCPKLQTLAIGIYEVNYYLLSEGHEGAVLPYPQPVPTCISLHLKTCVLNNYKGSGDELLFAKYILQNAKFLHIMKFFINIDTYETFWMNDRIRRDLFSCVKSSDTCELFFFMS
uniref:Cyclin-like F-box n=1 Tax=Phaseolus vulgaris TaxID=3885 RepID=D2DWA1_PHAVU|nr:cyclin-like F-box [Phaseolus vulgaris]